jgi:hypothetical protein
MTELFAGLRQFPRGWREFATVHAAIKREHLRPLGERQCSGQGSRSCAIRSRRPRDDSFAAAAAAVVFVIACPMSPT